MCEIRCSSLLPPAFHCVHRDVKAGGHTHYWLPGGRGSGKSSFVGVEIPLCLMRDAQKGVMSHAVALRRYGVTLRESVYAQLLWGVHALGAGRLWEARLSPLSLCYRPTGQRILFRGADDPMKLKSIRPERGYIKYAWYEEADEFEGEEKVRAVNQSLMRGGEDFAFFYTFNPPRSARNWCNQYVRGDHPGTLVHRTDYRTVPRAWLGEPFLLEAEHLRLVNPQAYAREYLGEVTGTGGEVFSNVTLRAILDEEIERFDHIRRGLDWGYATDPLAYNEGQYDKTRRRLYLFRELHQVRLSNREAARRILPWAGSNGGSSATPPSPKASPRSGTTACGWWARGKGPTRWSMGSNGSRTWRRSSSTPPAAPRRRRSSPATSWIGTETATSRRGSPTTTTTTSTPCATPVRTI